MKRQIGTIVVVALVALSSAARADDGPEPVEVVVRRVDTPAPKHATPSTETQMANPNLVYGGIALLGSGAVVIAGGSVVYVRATPQPQSASLGSPFTFRVVDQVVGGVMIGLGATALVLGPILIAVGARQVPVKSKSFSLDVSVSPTGGVVSGTF